MSLHYVVLLLGSNLGNTKSNLNQAIAKIENCLGNIIKSSEMIETQPVEFESSNVFTSLAQLIQKPLISSVSAEIIRGVLASSIKIESASSIIAKSYFPLQTTESECIAK